MNKVEEDEKLVGVREEDEENVVRRNQMIGCGHPRREQACGGKEEDPLRKVMKSRSCVNGTNFVPVWTPSLCFHCDG